MFTVLVSLDDDITVTCLLFCLPVCYFTKTIPYLWNQIAENSPLFGRKSRKTFKNKFDGIAITLVYFCLVLVKFGYQLRIVPIHKISAIFYFELIVVGINCKIVSFEQAR